MPSPSSRFRLAPETYRRITFAALLALVFIIITGATVRLSGSGLGCPEWPTCERGSLTPRGETGYHGLVEFVNRVITGAVSVAVILAVLGSLARVPRRRDLTRWSWGLVVGVAAQAILGGIVVRYHLAPVSVSGHFLLSMVLVWNALVLHDRAGRPDGARRRQLATPRLRSLSSALVGVACVVLVTGTVVTGAGPHGGDDAADRLDVAVGDVARIHAITVLVLLALTLAVLAHLRRGHGDAMVERRARVLLVVLVCQGAIGYTQYFTGVPVLLVAGHVVGAVALWVAVVWFHLGLSRWVDDDERDPAGATPVAATVT